MTNPQQTLGQYVLATRTSKGLTIADVCRRGGLSNTLWRQVENDEAKSFRDSTLTKIADGLDVRPAEVFERAGRAWPGGHHTQPDPLEDAADDRLSRVEAELRETRRELRRLVRALERRDEALSHSKGKPPGSGR